MDETTALRGTAAVVTGASGAFGRAIAAALVEAGATVTGVARTGSRLVQVEKELGPAFVPVAMDAAIDDPAPLLARVRPALVVLNAGATPPSAPLPELTWAEFSRNWGVDTRQAFAWSRAALLAPLAPGSTVVVVSSGAALQGSPLSGGYAGAKAAVRFVSRYAGEESDRAGLGIRFRTLFPPLTTSGLGAPAVADYAARAGVTPAEFAAGLPPVTPAHVAAAVVALATGDRPEREFMAGPGGPVPLS